MTLIRSEGSGDVDLGFYNNVATRSARFRQADSSYLYKTDYSGDGDLRQMTFSFWFKRGQTTIGPYNLGEIISQGYAGGGGTQSSARITIEADKLNIAQEDGNSTTWERISNRVFRDFSAWYHVVVALDVTEASSSDRVKAWVNGVAITWGTETSSKPDQNTDMRFGKIHMRIGVSDSYGSPWSASYFDGYISDFHYCDGEVKAATDFGEFNEGVWIPKKYAGSYGTNGFRLEFKQTGTGTAGDSTIGADTANNNDWTTSAFATTDSNIPDCPENNFATLNPIIKGYYSLNFSEGNLKVLGNSSGGAATYSINQATMACHMKSYWEVRVQGISANGRAGSGLLSEDAHQDKYGSLSSADMAPVALGHPHGTSTFHLANSDVFTDGESSSAGQIVMWAFDPDSGKVWYGVDGTWAKSGDPAAGSNPNTTLTTDLAMLPALHVQSSSDICIFNFGQDGTFAGNETAQGNSDGNGYGDFYYAPPSGFLALCSANLPEPTIGPNSATQADDHFNTVLYSGDGNSQAITGVGFQPDLLWIKKRSGTDSHVLFDSNRGPSSGAKHRLFSNTTAVESDGGVTVFGTDGFTVDGQYGSSGENNHTYVSWNWKANGGTTTTNDASATSVGDIDSVYQANTTSGFSIITYTGNATDGDEIAHGLGVAPKMLIIKRINATNGWAVYHSSLAANQEVYLNMDQAVTASDFWDSTAPTSTVWTVSDSDYVNTAHNYVCYAIAPVEGFSRVGTYTGNGSTDGVFIYTGFRPAWIITKRTDSSGNWYMNDTARSPGNPTDSFGDNLYAELNNAESGNGMDILSNGFKIRNTDASQNTSNGTYIYLAFAEVPFKYANGR